MGEEFLESSFKSENQLQFCCCVSCGLWVCRVWCSSSISSPRGCSQHLPSTSRTRRKYSSPRRFRASTNPSTLTPLQVSTNLNPTATPPPPPQTQNPNPNFCTSSLHEAFNAEEGFALPVHGVDLSDYGRRNTP
jgi:hypothetical protein